MRKALWYLLAGSRGGKNRVQIIRRLEEQPQNANQLAEQLNIEYNTVRYHLDLLEDHNVVETGAQEYGKMYFLTDAFETHRAAYETIIDNME